MIEMLILQKKTLKGLFFVHAYAIIEYVVYATVNKVILIINNSSITLSDIKPVVLSLALNPQIQAIKDVGRDKIWNKKIQLFTHFETNPLIAIDDSLIPTDGRNITMTQLHSIWDVFSVKAPIVPRLELQTRINEITENRRAIAHGRDRPADIGRRYTFEEIQIIKNDVNELSEHILNTFSEYCVNESFKKNQ